MAIRLRSAQLTGQSDSKDVRWYFVALVTAAIAISYFDRQTLPVAISAIQRTIPLNDQEFSWLQFAFLIPYALYAAGAECWISWGRAEVLFRWDLSPYWVFSHPAAGRQSATAQDS